MNAYGYVFKSIKKFNAMVNTFYYLSFPEAGQRLFDHGLVTVSNDTHQLPGPQCLEVCLELGECVLDRVVSLKRN